MKQGPATTKMIALVGEEWCQGALNLYLTFKAFKGKDTGVETILAQLAHVQKGVHVLRKRGYLTDSGELAVYDALLKNLGIYERPQVLANLIFTISSLHRPGPILDHALNLLIFFLKVVYTKKATRKPFWPVLADFLEEQEIKEVGEISPEELKARYNRIVKQYEFLIPGKVEQDEENPYEKFIINYQILMSVYSLMDIPKHERPRVIEPLFSPTLVRNYLDQKAKR